MSTKLYIVNERMLRWMDYAIQNGKAEHQKDWCERIGFPSPNISQVRSGAQGFTLVQIERAARLISGNVNWLFGLEDHMIRLQQRHSPLEILKAATASIEAQMDLTPRKSRMVQRSKKKA